MTGYAGPTLAEAFRRDGHAVLRGIVGDPMLGRAQSAAATEIDRARAAAPARWVLDNITVGNARKRNDALRDVVRAPQLARMAAAALGVARVRLLYDELFAKPTGATCTVLHQDQGFWPIDTSDVVEAGAIASVRAWVSLTSVPADIGGLLLVDGSHRLGPIDPARVQAGAPGDATTATVDGHDLSITDHGAFRAGDATLHAGFTIHGSRSNPLGPTRYSVAVAYVPDGTRVAEPVDEQQHLMMTAHIPGARPGDVIDSPANPVLWPPDDR